MNIHRRSFIAGLGAAIVAANLPVASLVEASIQPPAFTLPPNPNRWFLTAQYLFDCVRSIGEQLAKYDNVLLSDSARRTIAEAIDETLWQIKPAGLLILIETPLHMLVSGSFQLVETRPGIVAIKSVDQDKLLV